LGTVHHEYVFTVQEGLDALPEVIYHLETYDVTTVRASTPMYLLSRKIKAMGVKMVLSGEGSDEILGGTFREFYIVLLRCSYQVRIPLLPRCP
jgi:asparagine synthase (glutamine-hydrolysing)